MALRWQARLSIAAILFMCTEDKEDKEDQEDEEEEEEEGKTSRVAAMARVRSWIWDVGQNLLLSSSHGRLGILSSI
ncbi:hypothetical protein HZH66_014187 [Vespula vulgaris]|uniref:Uncharacterized protein n=1 Tax=Vespula vulgaris TaxID=7454 RepID=A0A834J2A2_VESVU|nr:hypothetical protein HZH66_014187 [Vespula vulgaris]